MRSLPELIKKTRGEEYFKVLPHEVLALDPGNTTGWALFVDGQLKDAGQEKLWNELEYLIHCDVGVVVYERFQLHPWRSEHLAWNEFEAVQVIGVIRYLAHRVEAPTIVQTPQVAKGFWTDKRLRQFDLYHKAGKHARDAVRHSAYYLAFGHKE